MHELAAWPHTIGTAWLAQDEGAARMKTGLEGEGAATQDPALGPGAAGGGGDPAGGGYMFLIIIVMMVVLLGMTALSGRKERKRHQSLVSGLQKRDKVRAAGGIIGSIIEVKDDELLLETDRASNTRIRVARSSVQSVLSSGGGSQGTEAAASE